MNIRRSFFICIAAGFVLTAVSYFGLFYLQLGLPTKKWGWLHAIIESKEKAAAAVTQPKLLIVAGSSALFGISAEEIERQTGFPSVNFGTNAALGTAVILHETRKVCRPGDVVLLACEYEQYQSGGFTGDNADELLIAYILGHNPDYVRTLSPNEKLKLAMLTPADRLWDGLVAVFEKPKRDATAEAFNQSVLADINSHGDQTGALPEKRPAQAAVRSMLCYIPAYGFPPSPPGFRAIREFCEWAKANNIRVLATFPNITHRPEYDQPAGKAMPAQFHALYDSIGVPVLGDISESMFPEEQMYDSYYHPLRATALERTRKLLTHLAPYLKAPKDR